MSHHLAPPRLEPTGKLAPQPWMETPEVRAVMAALTAGGEEARFVGGCVRDSILKRPVKDIDIATPEPPERVIALLGAAGIRAIPTGIEHGTITAVVNHHHYEITTLRRDVESFGRRAAVAFSRDWTEDAARRDFTINAMSCTLDGDIYDPFGGLEDLAERCIRFVGRAAERIDEDVLRLLRFFRFYAELGRPPPDRDALAACRSRAHKLPSLSGERVRGELLRLLSASDPAGVITLMRAERVLEHILPEAGEVGRLRLVAWLDTRAVVYRSVSVDPTRRLAALLKTDRAGAVAVAERLKFSNRERDRLLEMVEPKVAVRWDMTEDEHRRALYRVGAETVVDLTLLAWAGELSIRAHLPHPETDGWRALIEAAEAWRPFAFPIKGRDVAEFGIPPGPEMGRLLKEVEAWWQTGGLRADRAACLAELARRVGRDPSSDPTATDP